MPGSYIPTKDVDLVGWADNFRDLIVASPATYGLVAGDGTTIAGLVNTWDAAYATAVNPATRTPASVAAKDAAKGAMVPILRLYAQQVKNNAGVSNENKTALGLHINDTGPTPVPPPTSTPLLTLTGARHLLQEWSVRASETPTSKAKPVGSIAAEIFVGIGVAPIVDPTLCPFRVLNTKTPFTIDFITDNVGKVASVFARWVNRKGEVGPWSAPISFGIV